MWVWVTRYPRAYLGIYDHPDDTPGVESYKLPSNTVTNFVRDAQRFSEKIDDAIPGFGDLWDWTAGRWVDLPGPL